MQAGVRDDRSVQGFSLIEILVALLLLLLTVTIVGSGLVGALNMEQQTKERRAAEPLAEWLSARHAGGLTAPELEVAFEQAHPEASLKYHQQKAADDSIWDQWTIQASKESPAITLELLTNPPSEE